MYNLYKICSMQFGGHSSYGLRLRLNLFCFALKKILGNIPIAPGLNQFARVLPCTLTVFIQCKKFTQQNKSRVSLAS